VAQDAKSARGKVRARTKKIENSQYIPKWKKVEEQTSVH
jgi:hypothetical protein